MGIMEIIEKFRNRETEPEEEIDDDVTTDKFLRSLRRQRRIQIEEGEKVQLKKQIADHEREKLRGIFGREIKRKKIKVLKQKNSMVKNINIRNKIKRKQQGSSWLNRSNL